jgi:hypothetical protein
LRGKLGQRDGRLPNAYALAAEVNPRWAATAWNVRSHVKLIAISKSSQGIFELGNGEGSDTCFPEGLSRRPHPIRAALYRYFVGLPDFLHAVLARDCDGGSHAHADAVESRPSVSLMTLHF